MLTSGQKKEELKRLARKRRQTDPSALFGTPYYGVHEFGGGIYDSEDDVSPWSKSAQNADTEIMIVGQDWSSKDDLDRPIDYELARLGYDPVFTQDNLQVLLRVYFEIEFSQVYATNAFPFIKPGKLNARIPQRHMKLAVKEFLLPQIEIIRPLIVICLGSLTINAIRKQCGHEQLNMADAIETPFDWPPNLPKSPRSKIVAVAHTGRLGTNNRNRGDPNRVKRDWASIRRQFDELRA